MNVVSGFAGNCDVITSGVNIVAMTALAAPLNEPGVFEIGNQ